MQSRNLKDFFFCLYHLIPEPPEIISEFQYILGFEDKILILEAEGTSEARDGASDGFVDQKSCGVAEGKARRILGNNKTSKRSLRESRMNHEELGLISDSREIMSKMPKIQMEISYFLRADPGVVKSDFFWGGCFLGKKNPTFFGKNGWGSVASCL